MSDGNGVVHDRILNPARSSTFWMALGACLVAFAFAVLAVLAWRGYSASAARQRALIEQNKTINARLDEQIALNKTIAAQLAANQQEATDRAECVRRYDQRADDLHWAYVSTLGDVLVTFTTFVHGSPTQLAEIDADIAAVQAANAATQAAANERDAYTAQTPPPLPCPLGA
jgi:hypothetical protein